MKKALIFALLSFGMVLGGVSHAKEYKSMTVRIACSTPPGSVQAVPLSRLAEIVHKESNGKINANYTREVFLETNRQSSSSCAAMRSRWEFSLRAI